jgi:hypothetical protein
MNDISTFIFKWLLYCLLAYTFGWSIGTWLKWIREYLEANKRQTK